MNFYYHINQLCKKVSKKLHALARITKYMDINKQRMLMKAFVSSQFSCFVIIWIIHSIKMEHRVNRQKTKIKTKTNQLAFTEKTDQLLVTEIFKSKTGLSPELMNDSYHFVEKFYNLRSELGRKRDHIVYHGSESLSSLSPKLQDLLPNSIKNFASFKEFKSKINTWAFDRSRCRICKKYVHRVGII